MTQIATTKRVCAALNKAGEPCGVRPMRGTDLCPVHTPGHPVAANFASGHPPMPGAGRPAKLRAIDVLREKLEAEVAAVLDPMFGALAASRDGETDHAMRLRAAEALLDRAYGKPRQQVEHSGPDGGPITLAHLAQRAEEDDE